MISSDESQCPGPRPADPRAQEEIFAAGLDAPADPMWCVLPASELTLEKTWCTVGMRGTGSDTWIGDDVFVPDYLVMPVGTTAEAPGVITRSPR